MELRGRCKGGRLGRGIVEAKASGQSVVLDVLDLPVRANMGQKPLIVRNCVELRLMNTHAEKYCSPKRMATDFPCFPASFPAVMRDNAIAMAKSCELPGMEVPMSEISGYPRLDG